VDVLDVLAPGASERVRQALKAGLGEYTPEQEREVLEAFATAVVGVSVLTMLMEDETLGLTMDSEGQIQLVEPKGEPGDPVA
jgi:hypothetical protein